jgi:hypothetical protein
LSLISAIRDVSGEKSVTRSTFDENLSYQKNGAGRKIAILELSTNDWATIQRHLNAVIARLEACPSPSAPLVTP